MSNASNRNTEVPSRASIVFGMVVTGLSVIGTAAIMIGPDFGLRHFIGACFGVGSTVAMAGLTLVRIIQRDEALSQRGTWVHPQNGAVTFSLGQWNDMEQLAEILTEMERTGYQPADDDATRRIRTHLMIGI